MCDYQAMAKGKSLYNTGPTYSIYLAGLFFDYLKKKGGLAAINEESIQKSNILYDLIENSNGYYINPVQKEFRSRMNIPFRIKNGNNKFTLKINLFINLFICCFINLFIIHFIY